MSYQEIKDGLRRAEALVNDGKVEEADAVVRSLRGLSFHDLTVNLSSKTLKKLRSFDKRKRKAAQV